MSKKYTKSELQDMVWEAYQMDMLILGQINIEDFKDLSWTELDCLYRGIRSQKNRVISPEPPTPWNY
jgi:hypothetical protein